MRKSILSGLTLALALTLIPSSASAVDWQDNAFRLWYGPDFREPANPNDIPKTILSFTHVDGYKWGGNYLNIDLLYSLGSGGNGDTVQGLTAVKSAGAAEVVSRFPIAIGCCIASHQQ